MTTGHVLQEEKKLPVSIAAMTEHIQSTDHTLQYYYMQLQVVPVLYVRSSLL